MASAFPTKTLSARAWRLRGQSNAWRVIDTLYSSTKIIAGQAMNPEMQRKQLPGNTDAKAHPQVVLQIHLCLSGGNTRNDSRLADGRAGVAVPTLSPRDTKSLYRPTTQLPGVWQLITLPAWLSGGATSSTGHGGDKRGWWNTNCVNEYGKYYFEFFPMWMWLAIRNPANYWSRVMTGCDVSKCDITRLAGRDLANEDHPGWSFLSQRSAIPASLISLVAILVPLECYAWRMGTFRLGKLP